MNNLTSLELQVLGKFLKGDDQALPILRQQMEQAEVSAREMTGVGFYTRFTIPSEIIRIVGRPSFKLGDVSGKAANVLHGLGFLLYISDGALSMLEGYTYDDPWHDRITDLILMYSGGSDRNINDIMKIIYKK